MRVGGRTGKAGMATARILDWEASQFVVVVKTPKRSYVLAPVLLDQAGEFLDGDSVATLLAVNFERVTVDVPILRNANAAMRAEVTRSMELLSARFGLPIGPYA